jgi:uncharacterized membrane protein YgaE (UPF0421/DUF939 family)
MPSSSSRDGRKQLSPFNELCVPMSSALSTAKGESRQRLKHSALGGREWVDRFVGSDPGLNRLRSAVHCVLTLGVVLEAEWLFVHFTGAMQTMAAARSFGPAVAARVALANHEYLVIAMVLGGLVAMMSTFVVTDVRAKGQLISALLVPGAMLPALALGLVLGDHRVVSLVMIIVVLALGTYLRRFGPRGTLVGIMFFLGIFLGYFLHVALSLDDFGWLSAEIGVALVVALAIRFGIFFPHPQQALARTQRSYDARARRVARLALELFDDCARVPHDDRRLHHQLVRLNEAALMIDAQLGDPRAVAEGSSAQLLHQRLFDIELALSNIARFAAAMARADLPPTLRSEIHMALFHVVQASPQRAKPHANVLLRLLRHPEQLPLIDDVGSLVIVHRFAESVVTLTAALSDWGTLGTTDGHRDDFQPGVALFGGWLPGSAQVSATASLESGSRIGDRLRLAPSTRTAIQMGIAVSIATVLGIQISSDRFYWAVIAVFITFMGTSNSGEQVMKACFRIAGTVVGIGIGSLLVDAAGHDVYPSVAVILIAFFFGLYFVRTSYVFMVVGVTVVVAQLYEQLGEFSNSLLLLRLEETALGAAVAIVVVMTVLPLRTRRVLRVALRSYVQAVGELGQHATARLLGNGLDIDKTLRADARAVDAAYQALVATAYPLQRNLAGHLDETVAQTVGLAGAIRHYARTLVVDVSAAGALHADARHELERARATFGASVEAIVKNLSDGRNAIYTRSAALFDGVERRIEEQDLVVSKDELALRDLMLIDSALAEVAQTIGLAVTDRDTVRSARERGRREVPTSPRV